MARAEDKAQPWRELYDKLNIPVPGELGSRAPVTDLAGGGDVLHDGRFLSKRWFSLEHRDLGQEKVDALAARVTGVFQGQSWYEPMNRAKRCKSCGNDPCTCSVFEGG